MVQRVPSGVLTRRDDFRAVHGRSLIARGSSVRPGVSRIWCTARTSDRCGAGDRRRHPGDRLIGQRYVAQLDGFPPEGDSPWGGMSGAALLSEGLVIGVIGVIGTEPAGRAHAAMEAIPVSLLLRDAAFPVTVAAHSGAAAPRCEVVELRRLSDAQAQVPEGRAAPSPAGLLPAARGRSLPRPHRPARRAHRMGEQAGRRCLAAARPRRPGQDPPGPLPDVSRPVRARFTSALGAWRSAQDAPVSDTEYVARVALMASTLTRHRQVRQIVAARRCRLSG